MVVFCRKVLSFWRFFPDSGARSLVLLGLARALVSGYLRAVFCHDQMCTDALGSHVLVPGNI